LYMMQDKIQSSIAKKIIIIASCFMLFVLSGCIRITAPSRSTKPAKVIKRTFDVNALIAKLNEYKNYSFTVTKIYHDENGNNPEIGCIYTITHSGDLNKFKESRKTGPDVYPIIIYIHPDEKMLYAYDVFLTKYIKYPLDEDYMRQYYEYKNIQFILKIPKDPEDFHCVLLSENEEVDGEPCILVEDYHYIHRKMYISKNTGFPLRMEFDDNRVITITDIEIENISDTEFDVPAGAEYDPDGYITSDMVNGPF